MHERAPGWVRWGVGLTLAAPQLAIGLLAVLTPRRWFDSFPGFDPRLIAAEQPFNRHLASDTGAGFLAIGVALLVAALWADRGALVLALVAYVAFTVPHVLYHALHPADALSGASDMINVFAIGSGLVLAAVFGRGSLRRSAR